MLSKLYVNNQLVKSTKHCSMCCAFQMEFKDKKKHPIKFKNKFKNIVSNFKNLIIKLKF